MSQDFGRWIIHETGKDKIEALASVLYDGFKKKAEKNHAREFFRYSPWMSIPKSSKSWKFSEYEIGTEKNRVVNNKEALQYTRQELEKNEEDPLNIRGQKIRLEIFADIEDYYPESDKIFGQALDLLENSCTWMGSLSYKLIYSVMPICWKIKREDIGSGSSHLFIGNVFMGLPSPDSPSPRLDLAIGFAHELGHQALIIYQNSDNIISSAISEPTYSGVRKENRPAIMSFHACVALAFMVEACVNLSKVKLADEEMNYLKRLYREKLISLRLTLNGLSSVKFTRLGQLLLNDIQNLSDYRRFDDIL